MLSWRFCRSVWSQKKKRKNEKKDKYLNLARELKSCETWECRRYQCCILTIGRAVNQRFSLKISGSSHVVGWNCVSVMKWYTQMPTWDEGSLSLWVSAYGQKRAVSHRSASKWLGAPRGQRPTKRPTAGLWLSTLRPRNRRSVKWSLEDNTLWGGQEKKLWVSIAVCICPTPSVCLSLTLHCPVGWGCRIHRLHLDMTRNNLTVRFQ